MSSPVLCIQGNIILYSPVLCIQGNTIMSSTVLCIQGNTLLLLLSALPTKAKETDPTLIIFNFKPYVPNSFFCRLYNVILMAFKKLSSFFQNYIRHSPSLHISRPARRYHRPTLPCKDSAILNTTSSQSP